VWAFTCSAEARRHDPERKETVTTDVVCPFAAAQPSKPGDARPALERCALDVCQDGRRCLRQLRQDDAERLLLGLFD
jgi:hypothetical protein